MILCCLVSEMTASRLPQTDSMTTPPKASAASSVMWAGLSQGGRIIIQLISIATLSRLLPPTDFGLLAMATIVINFATLVRDMGTSAAVIQREQLSSELLDTVLWFNIVLGIGLAIAISIIAVPVSLFFKEPRLTGVLIALTISFPLTCSGAVHQALLERSMRFRKLARIELSSAGTALLISVVAARYGMGVYSLVLNTLTLAVMITVQLWWASPWRPTLRWSGAELKSLWKFSANLVGFQTVNYFTRNIDTILIGRFLGALQLGWYNTAYRIMLFPINNLSGVIARVLFPVLSRQQDDLTAFGALYLRAISGIALITAPLMAGIWALRLPLVETVLGARWLPVADVIAWLAPVGMLQSIVTTVGLIFMSTGNTQVMMRFSIVVVCVTFVSITIGLQWGYVGVATAYAVQNLCLFYPTYLLALRFVKLRFSDVLRAVGRQFLAAFFMAAALSLIDKNWMTEFGALSKTFILGSLGVVIYALLVWLFMRTIALDILNSIRSRKR